MRTLAPILLFILTFQFGMSQVLIPYRDGNTWGYANDDLEIVIPPQFKEAGEFRGDLSWVKKKRKYGYIDKRGEEITGFIYDKASNFGFGNAYVQKGKKKYCIDVLGQKKKCTAGCGGSYSYESYFNEYRLRDKFGLLIKSGEVRDKNKTTLTFDSIPAIWEVFEENYRGTAAVKKDSLWGVIDEKGELIVEYTYDRIEVPSQLYPGIRYYKVTLNGKQGFLGEQGELVVEPNYSKVEFFSKYNIAKVWLDDDFWGYIDKGGNEFFKRDSK